VPPVSFALPGRAAEPPRLAIETIFSRTFSDAVSTPDHAWLDDGTVLLLDKRVPAERPSLELLDPGSGSRRPACDAAKGLASLAGLLGEDAPTTLAWPDVVHRKGARCSTSSMVTSSPSISPRSTFRRLNHDEGRGKVPVRLTGRPAGGFRPRQ